MNNNEIGINKMADAYMGLVKRGQGEPCVYQDGLFFTKGADPMKREKIIQRLQDQKFLDMDPETRRKMYDCTLLPTIHEYRSCLKGRPIRPCSDFDEKKYALYQSEYDEWLNTSPEQKRAKATKQHKEEEKNAKEPFQQPDMKPCTESFSPQGITDNIEDALKSPGLLAAGVILLAAAVVAYRQL